MGSVELVLRPSGCLFFAVFTAGLDAVFSPGLVLGPVTPSHLVAAAAVFPLLVATLLLHEGGHAVALYQQGYGPIRITLRAGGASCDAVVPDERPGASLVRALAGPAVTVVTTVLFVLVWVVLPDPPLWRLVAKPVAIVGLVEGTVNTLPIYARSDGMAALRALVWLARVARGRATPPSPFRALYVWRPLALAVLLVAALIWIKAPGHAAPGSPLFVGLVLGTLALGAVPLVALAWRAMRRDGNGSLL